MCSSYVLDLLLCAPKEISSKNGDLILNLHTEAGDSEIRLENRQKLLLEIKALKFKKYLHRSRLIINYSFLYRRQAHITLRYNTPHGCRITIHWLICSTSFIAEAETESAHVSATRPFLNILGMFKCSSKLTYIDFPLSIHPRFFTIIGILGPSSDYAQGTVRTLRSVFRQIAIGSSDSLGMANNSRRIIGYDYLLEFLREYCNNWRVCEKMEYRE